MKTRAWLQVVLPAFAFAFASSANPTPWRDAMAAGATALRINMHGDAIKPTAAQTAAIRLAAADDIKEFNHPEQGGYSVATVDLNGDGRLDLIVQYDDMAFCGSSGCSGVIVMATARGYADDVIDLPNFYGEIDVLPAMHHGMHDLRYGDGPVWKWNGKEYDVAKDDLPGSGAAPWKTARAPGHPLMAYATPIDSVIKRILVACEQGQPLLMVLTKQRLPAGPVTLTFVFRGWAVNAPLQRNASNTNLWMADLSHSDLPEWLAHRGDTATTRELARLADMAFLRVNGRMEGEISLKDSTAATRSALATCYRY